MFLIEQRTEEKKRSSANGKKITEETYLLIQSLIDKNATISLNKIKEKILNQLSINISKSTIDRQIKNFNYSLKQVSLIPERRNAISNIDTRQQYAQDFIRYLGQFNESNIFFLDEVGFNVSMRSRFGRSSIGTTPFLTVPNLRSRNISVCCCMSKSGQNLKK